MHLHVNKSLTAPQEEQELSLESDVSLDGKTLAHGNPRRVPPLRRFLRRNGTLLLMGMPAILFLLLFNYIPMVGVILAFENYHPFDGIFGSEWVGLQNFVFLFSSNNAWRITFNTVFMNAIFIVVDLVVSLAVALLLNEIRDRSRWLSKFYQSVLFFPYFISYVIVSYFVFAILNADNGLLNHVLASLHLPTVDWYSAPQYWPIILTVVQVWKSAGFGIIIYLAGMVSINPEYFEAAKIDGASRLQQIRFITIPLLVPLIIINILFAIGGIFHGDFGLFFQVTNNTSQLYPTTDVIDTYVYRALTSLGDVGMAAAAGLYQALVGFILVILSNWIVRRADSDKALF